MRTVNARAPLEGVMEMNHETKFVSLTGLRRAIIATLAVLTIQGWTGDSVNLFSVFPQGSVNASFLGIVEALFAAGGIATYHAFEGILLIILATLVLALALNTRIRIVNLFAILGFVMVISAVIGGVLFVLSGFQNNGFSSQMATSFLGAYAFYFLELYYTKGN